MQKDHIRFFNKRPPFFHVFIDVFLKKSLVLAAHHRTHTWHHFCALILVELSSTLLLTANVFRVRAMQYLLVALVNLQYEFSAMAQNQDPSTDTLIQDPKWLKLLTVLMVVDGLQDSFLSLEQGGGVRKVYTFGWELLVCQEAILVFLWRALLLIICHAHNKPFINLDDVPGVGIPKAVSGCIAVEPVKLLDILKVISILCEFTELDRGMRVSFEVECVKLATLPEFNGDVKNWSFQLRNWSIRSLILNRFGCQLLF